MLEEIEVVRKQGKKVGITNGAFDLLHAGHARYLREAKKLCDILIVAINSDESVRSYKEEGRPVIPEQERAELVAALECVDYVIIFNDRRMQRLLEKFKSDFYIKGGDYKLEEMTSRKYVEPHGGKAVILPQEGSFSTSAIIRKIRGETESVKSKSDHITRNKAVFLDRDGTLLKEIEYLHEIERVNVLPGVMDGLKKMQDMGFKIVVITNQPGIGIGYYTKEDFYKVNKEMLRQLSAEGILVDKIYYCPHSKSEQCRCRKPDIELFKRAERELDLDINSCFVIGDQTSDIEAAKNIGCKSILVRTGQSGMDEKYNSRPDFVADNLIEIAKIIESLVIS